MNEYSNSINQLEPVSLKRIRTQTAIELCLLLIYTTLLERVMIPMYVNIWGYMLGGIYVKYNVCKTIISYAIVVFLYLIFALNGRRRIIYDYTYKMLLYMSIAPTIAMYSVIDNIHFNQCICPLVYYFVFTLLINKASVSNTRSTVVFKKIRNLDLGVLIIAFVFAVFLWSYLGFPITLSLTETFDQRMTMRTIELPSFVTYIYLMLGNVVVPYIFAKSFMNRKRIMAVVSLITGLLLFFSNGMKTWLLLYVIGVGIFIYYRLFKGNYNKIIIALEISFSAIIVLSLIALKLGSNILLGQLGRILVIPLRIGYKSIEFFSQTEHELLFLRESILKYFFESPYPGGSDFYMDYGTNTTLTSARANNGLWGDAFRNFGFAGMLIYPFLYIYIIKTVIISMEKQSDSVKLFIIILLIWSSINISFFTWLITGGVFFLIVILKTEEFSELNRI